MSPGLESRPDSVRTALTRARLVLLSLVGVQLLALLVSGVALFFAYRPSGGGAYGELTGDDVRSGVDIAGVSRVAHQVAAGSALPTAVVAGVLVAVGKRPSTRRRVDALVGVGLVLVMMAGSFTGHLLPWDHLGLRAVQAGNIMRGYMPLFDGDQVRFLLIGGAEVGPGTVVRWLLFHMLVVGGVLSALLAVAWRRGTRPHELIEPGSR